VDLNGKTGICIVGGGPAGSAAAIRLATLGYRVCVIESQAFPRRHIGESLSPGILPLLDFLGVRSEIEDAGFYRPRRAFVQWGSKDILAKDFEGPAAFQVDRGRFDQILLHAAEKAGATVVQPAFASAPRRTKGGKWEIPVHYEKQLHRITAGFLVDATGRRSFLKRKTKKYSPRTMALYAYWDKVASRGIESRVETGPKEWFWGAPLPDGTFNAAVFLDSGRLLKENVRASTLKDFYCSLLAETVQLEACLKGELMGPVHACDASIYRSEDIVDDNSIQIGEASYGIDPLSSQGVQMALQSAIQASIVVHTLLSEPGSHDAAIKFYTDQQEESVAANLRYAGEFYAEAMPFRSSGFWSKRAIAETAAPAPGPRPVPSRPFSMRSELRLSDDAQMIMTPCITGDVIRERLALVSPLLKRPVAFIGGIPADSLYSSISSGKTVAEVVGENDTRYPGSSTLNIINWLFHHQILVLSNGQGR
jgi:flavin-dependent dehydrogenase